MKHKFEIIIRKANGVIYNAWCMANTEEQAAAMIKLPKGENIIAVIKGWINTYR